MEKLVYLIWERPSIDPAALRARFLDDLAPQLLALGPHALQMDLDDEHAQMQSMVPGSRRRAARARVRLDLARRPRRRASRTKTLLRAAGTRVAGYLVTESMYRDYGDNEHTSETRLARRNPIAGHHHADDLRQARGRRRRHVLRALVRHQSPMSEDMQPRARYVRNAVVRPTHTRRARRTAPSSRSRGRASSTSRTCTPSSVPVSNEELGENIRVMLDSTKLLVRPRRPCATTRLSEYILKS